MYKKTQLRRLDLGSQADIYSQMRKFSGQLLLNAFWFFVMVPIKKFQIQWFYDIIDLDVIIKFEEKFG